MDSKVLYAIIAVAVIAIAAVAAFTLLNNGGNSDDADHTGKSFDDTRLRIYGNANGDDLIDKTDLNTINWIIKSNKDSDSSKHVDWAKDYPLADANYDGKVDDKDSTVVQDIIDKKKTRMYYYNKYERVTYVNYPISDKIGAEYLILQLLPAIKSYSMLKAIDDTTPSIYNNVYPGVDKMPVMGTWREITIESLTDLYIMPREDGNGSVELPEYAGRIRGAQICMWNDLCDELAIGITEYDMFDRLYHALPMFSARCWNPHGTMPSFASISISPPLRILFALRRNLSLASGSASEKSTTVRRLMPLNSFRASRSSWLSAAERAAAFNRPSPTPPKSTTSNPWVPL